MLDGIREDLADPDVIAEVERRVRATLKARRQPQVGNRERIGELQQQIANLTDAIAGGMLRSSPAIAQRLAAAETQLGRLQAAQAARPVAVIAPDVRKQFLGMLARLGEVLKVDPERGRTTLREVLGDKITLRPDGSGRFLWADYSLGIAPLLQGAGASAEIMVAGAGFEPATFGL
jgi:hypothetical protein